MQYRFERKCELAMECVRSVTRAKMVNTTILQMTFRPQMKAGVGRCGVQGIQEENSEGYES